MTKTPPHRKPLTAGSEIDAWCTRCRMDLGHRIVAMVGQDPKRVVCMTCGSEHNYRAPKSAELIAAGTKRRATKGETKGRSTRAAAQTLARQEWEKRVRSGAPLRRYATTETYKENDLITHKKFGDGYVRNASGQKISVAFSDGERTLIHGLDD